jgi:hypothetical protein
VDKKPSKEWWAWYLAPPVDYRKLYGNALEFDELDRYYQALYEKKLKEKIGYNETLMTQEDRYGR